MNNKIIFISLITFIFSWCYNVNLNKTIDDNVSLNNTWVVVNDSNLEKGVENNDDTDLIEQNLVVLTDEMYNYSESVLATLKCDEYLNLQDNSNTQYNKYVEKCEQIQLPAKISFYQKELEMTSIQKYPIESNYKAQYEDYKNVNSQNNYDEYLKSSASFSGITLLNKEDFEKMYVENNTYDKYLQYIINDIKQKRKEFDDKKVEYKKFIEENKSILENM